MFPATALIGMDLTDNVFGQGSGPTLSPRWLPTVLIGHALRATRAASRSTIDLIASPTRCAGGLLIVPAPRAVG
jgi:hypothetical protein